MNRADLQLLTRERIEDAQALFREKRWSFCYYTAGYAVECALKSCVLARMIETGWIFRDKARIEECRTHDFERLIGLAGMMDLWNEALAVSAAAGGSFAGNWKLARGWTVVDRYTSKTEAEAKSFLECITHENDGVLPWLQKYW